MFDTHCHLNFKAFAKDIPGYIDRARAAGVTDITVPGTDIATSRTALAIAQQNDHIYAAIGIHPHHVFALRNSYEPSLDVAHMRQVVHRELQLLKKLVTAEKIVAIGECGLDRHTYQKTKYEQYEIDDVFLAWQTEIFVGQIVLAVESKKSLIVHNREAKTEMMQTLSDHWDSHLEHRAVFHCCEPDSELLRFALTHHMFIGVDGDITFRHDKQEFIATVPMDMLVLETDAPFLLPEPYRSRKAYPNEPAYGIEVAKTVARLRNISVDEIQSQTSKNAHELFCLA